MVSCFCIYVQTHQNLYIKYVQIFVYELHLNKALKNGVILRPLGDVIYFNPPLIIEKEDMDFVVDIAFQCVNQVLN